jgi:hypothetical protein
MTPVSRPGRVDGIELRTMPRSLLARVARELMLAAHLQDRASVPALLSGHSLAETNDVGRKLFGGVGWIAERLVDVLDLDDSLASIAAVLRTCHLTLIRDYLGLTIARPADDELVVTLAADAPALAETDAAFSLSGLLDLGADEILASIAGGVNPRARVARLPHDPASDVRAAWRVTIDRDEEPAREPKAVEIVRFSTGPTTVFIRRRPVRR